MNKIKILKILNPVLFILIMVQILGGFLLDKGIIETGWELHRNLPYFLGVLIILHLYLNWGWVAMSYFKKNKK